MRAAETTTYQGFQRLSGTTTPGPFEFLKHRFTAAPFEPVGWFRGFYEEQDQFGDGLGVPRAPEGAPGADSLTGVSRRRAHVTPIRLPSWMTGGMNA